METITKEIDGVKLICQKDFKFRSNTLDNYPDCCGPSNNKFLNWIIPDEFFNVPFQAACDIHDFDFAQKIKSWEHFHAANGRLFRNMFAIYEKYQETLTQFEKIIVIRAIADYLIFVDSVGSKYYWSN